MISRLLKKLSGNASKQSDARTNSSSNSKRPSASKHKSQSKGVKSPDNHKSHPRKKHQQKHPKKESSQPAWDVSQFKVAEKEGETRFHDLNLPDSLLHAIQDLGFEYCSPIQAQILPHTLQGNDAIGKAQTGTGKTAAFLITMITDLLANPVSEKRYHGEPRALIIAPTRELVVQIADDAKGLCKYAGLNVVTLIGGADFEKQRKALDSSFVDIVVATPGRLIDFVTRENIYLDRVESLVLDEADRMLDLGFIPQVKRIVRATPSTEYRQTQLFSATFTQDVINLSDQWTHQPIKIEIEPESVANSTVDQKVYMVASKDKSKVLMNILRGDDVGSVIIFANRRDQTRKVFEKVSKAGFKAGILSGEIPQNKRTRTLDDFKKGNIKIMVATDVAGRGIHVDGISHVINYNLPEDPEDYVHRIGRTGRAGASGTSISLACENEAFELPTIEKLLGNKLKCEMAPSELYK